MSTVYRRKANLSERRVAIKVLHPKQLAKPDIGERFLPDEAWVANQIDRRACSPMNGHAGRWHRLPCDGAVSKGETLEQRLCRGPPDPATGSAGRSHRRWPRPARDASFTRTQKI